MKGVGKWRPSVIVMNCFGLEPCLDVSFVTDVAHCKKSRQRCTKFLWWLTWFQKWWIDLEDDERQAGRSEKDRGMAANVELATRSSIAQCCCELLLLLLLIDCSSVQLKLPTEKWQCMWFTAVCVCVSGYCKARPSHHSITLTHY